MKSEIQLNLCLITPYYYPEFSGAGERYRRYMHHFQEMGVKIHIITRAIAEQPQEELVDGVRITRFDIGSQHKAVLHKCAIDLFQREGVYPDVIQTLVYFNSSAIPSLWRLKRLRIPVISTVTMSLQDDYKSIISYSKGYILNRLASYLFTVTVVSAQTVKEGLIASGYSSLKVRIVPNGIDTSRFYPTSNADMKRNIRDKLRMPSNIPIIVFTGFIETRKGIETLLQAWDLVRQNHSEAQLWLVGPFPRQEEIGKLPVWVMEVLKQKSTDTNIYLTGLVNNVEDYLRAGDIFVFPSKREGGQPNSLMEALATGLPCIVTPYKGLSNETGIPDIHYLLTAPDADKIAEHIIYLIDHPERRNTLGADAADFIKNSMNTEHVTNALVDLYHEVQQ